MATYGTIDIMTNDYENSGYNIVHVQAIHDGYIPDMLNGILKGFVHIKEHILHAKQTRFTAIIDGLYETDSSKWNTHFISGKLRMLSALSTKANIVISGLLGANPFQYAIVGTSKRKVRFKHSDIRVFIQSGPLIRIQSSEFIPERMMLKYKQFFPPESISNNEYQLEIDMTKAVSRWILEHLNTSS